MTMTDTDMPAAAPRAEPESAKRRDIIDGARKVFFEKGFDGASMDEVARAASVSKATIYVYFGSKDELFEALVLNDRARSAEHLFEVDPSIDDVASLLHRIGTSFMTMMVQPDHIRLVRMVIAIAEKFPRVGRAFFDAGPCHGGQRLASLLRQQADLGRLRIDDELAAAFEFLNLCQSNSVKGLLFGVDGPPTPAQIEETVERAVRIFLAYYGTDRAS
ncbi:TetR/AcrR family transcriptional regulator [Ancylobacter rudongensis]|uniref:Transcriptional regulator, TetR family n=1 Tax=Ancylobacter rudongensis TaxID=177413 RepID=A0A1G4PUS6_9HYPH|nr:TetR/AcrR family transcriptional regulator [Ancylobacter rudongensis]SCW36050.1 transcriptional regulator, TetR family [Ancylobacter rudongensis]